jgi:hypothetical protein
MVSRKIGAVAIVLIIVIIVLGAFVCFRSAIHPASTPVVSYSLNYSPLNTKDMNVSQGTTLLINLNFTSRAYNQMTIPLENLGLVAYSDKIDYLHWDVSNWNSSIIQEKVFNYSFGTSQLDLQPAMSNSTVLTINLAQDAPLGRYELYLNIGSVKDELSGLSYSGSIPIAMIVTPKQE